MPFIQHLIVTLLIAVFLGSAAVFCKQCTNSQVQECFDKMESFNYKDKTVLCQDMFDANDCLDKLEKSCELDDSKKRLVENSRDQVADLLKQCKEEKSKVKPGSCSLTNLAKCMKALEEENNADEVNENAMCKALKDASECLTKRQSLCENEKEKTSVSTSISGLIKQGERYKCKEKGYKVGENSGVMLQPALVIFTSVVLVWSTFLIQL